MGKSVDIIGFTIVVTSYSVLTDLQDLNLFMLQKHETVDELKKKILWYIQAAVEVKINLSPDLFWAKNSWFKIPGFYS